MKCCVCGGQGVRIIHTSWFQENKLIIEWRYYCDNCILLGKISGHLQTNPMTHREQWYIK